MTTTSAVAGSVDPAFDSVQEVLERHQHLLGNGGAAVAVTVDGQQVIDLWAGDAAPGRPWQEDTLAILMSCTKGLAALCVQLLVDRGQLALDATVAGIWPEFAQHGKGDITVRQVMTHTAGVLGFDGAEHLDGWGDQDDRAAALAASVPSWPAGTRHGYHAISFGWLVAEIVRRVDGRSIGQLFAAEVAGPLGLDVHIGTPAGALDRVAAPIPLSLEDMPEPVATLYRAQLELARTPGTLLARSFLGGDGSSVFDRLPSFMLADDGLTTEMAACNGTATARGLARMWGALANGGAYDGVRLLSAESVESFNRTVVVAADETLEGLHAPGAEIVRNATVARTEAYQANHPLLDGRLRFGPSETAFGTEGFGGQLTFADPERRVSFAFVRSDLVAADALAPLLVDAIYASLF